jgi:hypothetical protein
MMRGWVIITVMLSMLGFASLMNLFTTARVQDVLAGTAAWVFLECCLVYANNSCSVQVLCGVSHLLGQRAGRHAEVKIW